MAKVNDDIEGEGCGCLVLFFLVLFIAYVNSPELQAIMDLLNFKA